MRRILLVLAVAVLLVGCGQKGPLYLPEAATVVAPGGLTG